jgi:drug/metabolite transporter (DMT)-like permease
VRHPDATGPRDLIPGRGPVRPSLPRAVRHHEEPVSATTSPAEHSAFARSLPGILAMSAAMALFTANDTLVKLAAADLPASEIMALRGLFATLVVGTLVLHRLGVRAFRAVMRPPVLIRSLFEAIVAFAYISAIATAGIAETTAVLQLSPIFLTLAGVFVLGERVSGRAWIAILAAFAGVMLIVKPDVSGIDLPTTLALVCALFVAIRDFFTREIDPTIPSLVVTLAATLSVPALGLALAPMDHWQVPTLGQVALLAGAAVFVGVGNVFIVLAYRSGGEISVISPFRYCVVLWALLSSVLVFDVLPDALALGGTAIVVGAGLYLWHVGRFAR